MDDFTASERRAIIALQRLAKRWPQTLTLFSWAGTLVVIRSDQVYLPGREWEPIESIEGIPNDGGDP